MNRKISIAPAEELLDAACKRSGFVGLVGVVNSGKTPLLEQLEASLIMRYGSHRVMSVPLFADANESLREFNSSDCTVLLMREFREIDEAMIHLLLSNCRNKVVVAGLHPGVDHRVENANQLGVSVQFIQLAEPDLNARHVREVADALFSRLAKPTSN